MGASLDLYICSYTIRHDPDADKICTIILPWGKYSHERLPMGVAGLLDIFQSGASNLMSVLEKLKVVLETVLQAGLSVDSESTFYTYMIDYHLNLLNKEGLKALL